MQPPLELLEKKLLWDVCTSCWKHTPEFRITIDQIITALASIQETADLFSSSAEKVRPIKLPLSQSLRQALLEWNEMLVAM